MSARRFDQILGAEPRPARAVQPEQPPGFTPSPLNSLRSRPCSALRRRSGVELRLALLAISLFPFVGLSPIASANASYDPLGGGTTKLTLDPTFAALLRADGVRLTAIAPAAAKGTTYTLPVSGGALDPTAGKGEVDNAGVLVLRRGARSVIFRRLVVKTRRQPLLAKVGGGQLKVATGPRLDFSRRGFGSLLSAPRLFLTAKLATRLDKKLRLPGAFYPGQPFASLRSSTAPRTLAVLPQGRATIVLDPAILAKLNGLFVAVNPIFPAEHQGATFTFPIIGGGQISPDAAAGTLRTGGEIELLQLGGGQIFWHELWSDFAARATLAEANLQPSPPYPGKQGQVPILDQGALAASSDPGAHTVTLSGVPLTLQAATAAAFDQAFDQGKEAFRPGELFGTLSFAAKTQ